MTDPALPIVFLTVLAIGIAVAMLSLAKFLGQRFGPQTFSQAKMDSFESGMPSEGYRGESYNIKFFLVAILFILFDVEIICLYPWTVVYTDLGFAGLVAVGFFLLVLFGAFVYAWKRGALEWGQ